MLLCNIIVLLRQDKDWVVPSCDLAIKLIPYFELTWLESINKLCFLLCAITHSFKVGGSLFGSQFNKA
jgi:hypothetical protein